MSEEERSPIHSLLDYSTTYSSEAVVFDLNCSFVAVDFVAVALSPVLIYLNEK